MGLRAAKSHEKPTGDADWEDGGADPLVRAGRPRPAARPTISAPSSAPTTRRGRRATARGVPPTIPRGFFDPVPGLRRISAHLAWCILFETWDAQMNPQ